jgi:hypothetical protein
MAVAGGTVIPYPFLPEVFQTAGPYSFNLWAQRLIAAALFGDGASGATQIMAVFSCLAAALFIVSIFRIRKEYA